MKTDLNTGATAEQWLDQLDPNDPNVEVRSGRYLRRVSQAADNAAAAGEALHAAVADARANGESWAMIGLMLGVSKQAAQQRFGS